MLNDSVKNSKEKKKNRSRSHKNIKKQERDHSFKERSQFNEAKSTETHHQFHMETQSDQNNESTTLSIDFLPPQTDPQTLRRQIIKIKQANAYIMSQIKDLAIQKYHLEQNIHKITQRKRVDLPIPSVSRQ